MSNKIAPPDPNQPSPVIPAGDVLIALIWFRRRQSERSGNEYMRCCFKVVAGKHEGLSFFCPWSLDTSKIGSRRRTELWMEAVGCDREIDLDSDTDFESAFLGKAFKARLRVDEQDGYRKNDIERLIYPRHWSEADRKAIAEWAKKWAERGWQTRDPGDPGPQDADARGERRAPQAEPHWSEGSRFADPESDDDFEIPF